MAPTRAPDPRNDTRLFAALVLGFFGFYMLTGSRERPWGDAQVMWEVAVSLVERHAIDIAFEWPPMSHRGVDGRVFAQYPILPSLVQVPGATIVAWLSEWFPAHKKLWWPLASHLAPSLAAAWTVGLYYRLARHLGVNMRIAAISAVAVGLATALWIYARYSYSEALQAVCFTATVWHAVALRTDNRRRDAIGLGLWLGLLFNTKPVFAVAGMGVALVLGFAVWRDRQPASRRARAINLLIAGAMLVPFLVLFGAYNHARWGHFATTGYEDTVAYIEGESPLFGAFGLLLSPGKSVFLYNPPLVVAAVGWVNLWRARPHDATLIAAATLPPMFVYTNYLNWSGGWCFGPRYWLFAVPVLMLGLPFVINSLRTLTPRMRFIAATVLSLALFLGASVQVLGNLFYWDHYIRIAKAARTEWLGDPDRSGSKLPERGRGHCDSCFEDMYPLLWLPAFQPIEGHYWLAQNLALGHGWRTAEASAPWKRYTSKPLDIKRTYRRARLDWWVMILRDQPQSRGTGTLVGGLWLASTLGGFALARPAVRRRRRTAAPSEVDGAGRPW